jgi:hypothetical protein
MKENLMNTSLKIGLVGCAMLAGLAVNEFWPSSVDQKSESKIPAKNPAKYTKPASAIEAPAWVAQAVPELYKAQIDKDNANAKEQFGPLYIDSSKVEVIDVKSVDCFGIAQVVGSWTCDLKTSVRLGGKTIAAREVEVQVAKRNNEPMILSSRQVKF